MIKNLDEQGRCYIPKGYRKKLNLHSNDDINISCFEDKIIIKKNTYSIDYEQFIRILLIVKRGIEYKNYSITQQEIKVLEQLLEGYIDNQFNCIDIK